MLTDLRDGNRDAVLVVDQDRLTRRPLEMESFIEMADGLGIALATVSGDTDLSTTDGRLIARIQGSVARQSSEKASDRLKRQREQAASLGQFHGGQRRYGFERDGVTFRADEVKVIREIARRLLGGESMRSVVLDLNARGVSSAKGGEWAVSQLRRMISAPRLAGLRTHHGEVVGEAQWEPILTRGDHERLKALVESRPAQRGRPALSLLGGIATCALCGGVLHQTRVKSTPVYRCAAITPGKCGGVASLAAPLDQLVSDAVLHRIDSKAVARALNRPRRAARSEPIENLAQIDADLDALATDHGSGLISRREWLAARAPLDARRKAALDAIEPEEIDDKLIGKMRDAGNVRKAWDVAAVEVRRQILSALVERISLSPTNKRGANSFDPDRVDIAWRV